MAIPLPCSEMRVATEPTMVTSRPSSIQQVPRAASTTQCHRDQGRRSKRAEMSVRTVPRSGASAMPSTFRGSGQRGRESSSMPSRGPSGLEGSLGQRLRLDGSARLAAEPL
jgi:hypothetical protein